ncbi:HU family DNA-binding protein [Propionibacteriaceae bacterium Y1685]|uniref:HU family DNA-binding protein n=1 Tax=Microlunatus sp. Y1700 TaxID=3418487 RepID=UPI002652B54C|nr:HU family DNA-binding protein [Propionibacteriales bacterium]
MSKKELVEAIAKGAELSQADAERALTAVFGAITDGVAKGDKVAVPGFGTFEKRDRAERTGRNPRTGEEMTIAATSVPGFKAATQFKKAVAG